MYIVSIKTEKRKEEIPDVQQILTTFGEAIDTRLGIHTKNNQGLIIVVYTKENVEEFVEELNTIGSVTANYMEA